MKYPDTSRSLPTATNSTTANWIEKEFWRINEIAEKRAERQLKRRGKPIKTGDPKSDAARTRWRVHRLRKLLATFSGPQAVLGELAELLTPTERAQLRAKHARDVRAHEKKIRPAVEAGRQRDIFSAMRLASQRAADNLNKK